MAGQLQLGSAPAHESDRQVYSRVEFEIIDSVAEVRLNRPEKLNALDIELFHELIQICEDIAETAVVRSVLLCGNGRSFCGGIDLDALSHNEGIRDRLLHPASDGGNLFQRAVMLWRSLPVPVVAAVHGHALGGGLQLALGADVRIVDPQASLSVREIALGLIPDMAGMVLLRGLLRDDVIRDLAFSGRTFSGQEAFELGLATRLSDDPLKSARDIARHWASFSPDAVRAAKRLMNLVAGGAAPSDVLAAEAREQHVLLGGDNHREAVAAFLARRRPNFQD